MNEIEDYTLDALQKEYLENHNTWKIEESILDSFKRWELKKCIEGLNKEYLDIKLPYIKQVWEAKKQQLWEFDTYFIDQLYYCFHWWEELYLHRQNMIQRFENFYKRRYANRGNKYINTPFDINSVPIVEVLSNYMRVPQNLKRNISCPIHKEKTGSFKIYTSSNSWYCFGCMKWGNAINFVSEVENISNNEAFKKLANLYSNQNTYGK